jgi:hypothetical protein
VYLIDSKGTIVYAHVGFKKERMAKLVQAVERLLEKGSK